LFLYTAVNDLAWFYVTIAVNRMLLRSQSAPFAFTRTYGNGSDTLRGFRVVTATVPKRYAFS